MGGGGNVADILLVKHNLRLSEKRRVTPSRGYCTVGMRDRWPVTKMWWQCVIMSAHPHPVPSVRPSADSDFKHLVSSYDRVLSYDK